MEVTRLGGLKRAERQVGHRADCLLVAGPARVKLAAALRRVMATLLVVLVAAVVL